MGQLSGSAHRHGAGQLVEGTRQAASDEPGAEQATSQREDENAQEYALLRGKNLFQPGIGAADAGLPCSTVNLAIHLGESGEEPALQLALGSGEGRLPLAGVEEPEDAVGYGLDFLLDPAHSVGEPHLLRAELGPPALLPVVHTCPERANSFRA